jgi:hypothetical protein
MFNSQDSNITSHPNLVIDNVNKVLSTFIPANNRRESNEVGKQTKMFINLYIFFVFYSYSYLSVLNHMEQLLVRLINLSKK